MSEQQRPNVTVIYQEQKPDPGIDLIAWLKVAGALLALFGLLNACSWLV